MSSEPKPDAKEFVLSLVRGDVLFRLQRRLGLIPSDGFGLGRRAVFWALLAWLPVAAWAVYAGRAFPPLAGEPLLAHFGVHVRCLVAIPLLVIAEAPVHQMSMRLLPRFVSSGIVPPSEVDRFRATLTGIANLRDATMPWILLLGIVLSLNTMAELMHRSHEVTWAIEPSPAGDGALSFGALWFLYVSRPIHFVLLIGWLWRIGLVYLLLFRISKLDLSLVPVHPDRAAGLGFLEATPKMFALVVLALGSVLAARWGHDVLYHGVHVADLKFQMAAYVVVVVAIFTLPLLAFTPSLAAAKRNAVAQYSTLVGRHGRLVHARWIFGEKVDDDGLLSAPELGPVADINAAYDAVTAMRVVPIGKKSVMPLMAAAVLPLLPVIAIEIPIAEVLKALMKAVV